MTKTRTGKAWSYGLAVLLLIAAALLLVIQSDQSDRAIPSNQDAAGAEGILSNDEAKPDPVIPKPFEGVASAEPELGRAATQRGLLVSKKSEAAARIYGIWEKSEQGPATSRRVRLHLGGDETPQLMVVATDVSGLYEAWVPAGDWRVMFDNDTYSVSVSPKQEVRRDHRDPPHGGARVIVTVAGSDAQVWNALVTLSSATSEGGQQQVFQGRTDQNGRVTFEGVRAAECSVTGQIYRSSGGRPIRATASVLVPTTGDVAVSLVQPRGRLLVAITDSTSGEPVAGADVEFRSDGARGLAVAGASNALGECTLIGANPGAGTLLVKHPEYAPWRGRHPFPNSAEAIQLKLLRGASIPVKAMGEGGRPMAIILRARTRGEDPPRVWEWPLNDSGEGMMDRLPEEDVELELLAAGCESLIVRSTELLAMRNYVAEFKSLPRPEK